MEASRGLLQEMRRQSREILLAIAQRRHLDRDDIETIEQVLAKSSFFNFVS